MLGAYVIGIVVMLVSLYVQWRLKSKFEEYSQVGLSNGMSGKEIAETMLRESGIYDVRVLSVEGRLTDHYNPQDKTVNLSPDVYYGRSVAAAAVASHECGHAVQHATAYSWLQFRSQMVPFLSIASQYMQWIILIGVLLINTTVIPLTIGVALFAVTTLFSFITLPVEYDASNRALAWIQKNRIVNEREYIMSADALKWAARTYLVAAIGSLATLLYYVSLLMGRRD
ncbi:zinc metallopeptidase [Dyadobacter fermentans]|uniref:Peptidase membrane zinc metallopeptidase putative n=1 Tax=Dyadobacter fermentans (strain ATCC 700827 / DSM 18053 / CIP 107007 / KCTC 52180 / NS114) TaxID=471854 RepID=C6W3Q5_DYAFD|nr:zinc metallopeptidase [Dyadobacter fermentans]ACT95753.1 peptidase membrane zinc metallopeptidase putative [Dyadobacter fermentans DSM 18053]